MALPKLPEWAPSVIIPFVMVIFSAGGMAMLFEWRITQLEQRQTGLEVAQKNAAALEVIKSELRLVSSRTSDAQLTDWNRWRAGNDAKNEAQDEELENHEARIDRLERQR